MGISGLWHACTSAFAFAVGTLWIAANVQAASPCERACLTAALDAYLSGVIRHEPAAALLTANYRATENGSQVAAGEGIWRTASGLGTVQRRYADPSTGQAAIHGIMAEGTSQSIVSLRVKVQDNRISEAEWTIARPDGNTIFDSAGMAALPPPDERPLPKSQRTARFTMIALANGYFQALQEHDGSSVPAEAKCPRVENGVRMTFRKRSEGLPGAAPAPASATPTAAQEEISGNCVAGFEIFKDSIAETTLRRFPLIDEEQGVVMGTTLFRRPNGSARKRNLLTEYFYIRGGYIRGGKIAGIWATMYYLPADAPNANGWSQ